jgi:hypothetical protein
MATDPTEDRPRIDSFIAADWAEAINGKLYLMGGGFDTLWAPTFPFAPRFAFGAVLRVPWNDTNRKLPIEGVVETTDGEDLGWRMGGELEAGRPPGKRGGDVTVVIAGPVQFQVEEPTSFVLKLRFAGQERSIALAVSAPPFQIIPPGGRPPGDQQSPQP